MAHLRKIDNFFLLQSVVQGVMKEDLFLSAQFAIEPKEAKSVVSKDNTSRSREFCLPFLGPY